MKFAEWRLWVCKLPKCTLAPLMCEAGHVYKLPKYGVGGRVGLKQGFDAAAEGMGGTALCL